MRAQAWKGWVIMINSVVSRQRMNKTLAGGSNPGRTPAETAYSFEELMEDKKENDMTTGEYLAALMAEQFYIIRTMQRTAVHIDADKLSKEGAEDLFVPLGDNKKYADWNTDRTAGVGEAKIFVFPPPGAPEPVKAAWEETIRNMTFSERTLIMSPFMAAQIEANVRWQSDGTYDITFPGDPGYVNIFGARAENYYKPMDKILERLTALFNKSRGKEKKKYEFQVNTISKFKQNIILSDSDI